MAENESATHGRRWRMPWRKLGWGVLLFFFLKGLVWLAVLAGGGLWLWGPSD